MVPDILLRCCVSRCSDAVQRSGGPSSPSDGRKLSSSCECCTEIVWPDVHVESNEAGPEVTPLQIIMQGGRLHFMPDFTSTSSALPSGQFLPADERERRGMLYSKAKTYSAFAEIAPLDKAMR